MRQLVVTAVLVEGRVKAFAARSKAAASGIPLIDGHVGVRHDKIDTTGKLSLRHDRRLHHISLGAHTPANPSSSWSTTFTSACSGRPANYRAS